MLLPQLLTLALALAPSLVAAAIFPADTRVKMLDAKKFKKVMKENVHVVLLLLLQIRVNSVSLLADQCRCVCCSVVRCTFPLEQCIALLSLLMVLYSTVKGWRRNIAKQRRVFTP